MDTFSLFAIDPRGFRVLCHKTQLNHVYDHHPELRKFGTTEKDLKLAITAAFAIYQSTKGKGYHVYYLGKSGRNIELKVVVKFNDDNTGILWAAQPSTVGQRKPGEIMIWPQTKS